MKKIINILTIMILLLIVASTWGFAEETPPGQTAPAVTQPANPAPAVDAPAAAITQKTLDALKSSISENAGKI